MMDAKLAKKLLNKTEMESLLLNSVFLELLFIKLLEMSHKKYGDEFSSLVYEAYKLCCLMLLDKSFNSKAMDEIDDVFSELIDNLHKGAINDFLS